MRYLRTRLLNAGTVCGTVVRSSSQHWNARMGRLTDRGAIQQSVSDDTASCLRRLTSAGHYHQHLQPSVQAAIETVHLDTAQLTEVFDDSLKPETNDFFAWTRTHFAFHSIFGTRSKYVVNVGDRLQLTPQGCRIISPKVPHRCLFYAFEDSSTPLGECPDIPARHHRLVSLMQPHDIFQHSALTLWHGLVRIILPK